MAVNMFMYEYMNDFKSIIAKNTIFVLSVVMMEMVSKIRMEDFREWSIEESRGSTDSNQHIDKRTVGNGGKEFRKIRSVDDVELEEI